MGKIVKIWPSLHELGVIEMFLTYRAGIMGHFDPLKKIHFDSRKSMAKYDAPSRIWECQLSKFRELNIFYYKIFKTYSNLKENHKCQSTHSQSKEQNVIYAVEAPCDMSYSVCWSLTELWQMLHLKYMRRREFSFVGRMVLFMGGIIQFIVDFIFSEIILKHLYMKFVLRLLTTSPKKATWKWNLEEAVSLAK